MDANEIKQLGLQARRIKALHKTSFERLYCWFAARAGSFTRKDLDLFNSWLRSPDGEKPGKGGQMQSFFPYVTHSYGVDRIDTDRKERAYVGVPETYTTHVSSFGHIVVKRVTSWQPTDYAKKLAKEVDAIL